MKKIAQNWFGRYRRRIFLGGCATGKAPEGQQHSGFLKEQLKQEKDAAGDPVLRT